MVVPDLGLFSTYPPAADNRRERRDLWRDRRTDLHASDLVRRRRTALQAKVLGRQARELGRARRPGAGRLSDGFSVKGVALRSDDGAGYCVQAKHVTLL